FILSHGWKGDIPAAIEQYDNWIATMASVTSDVDAAHKRRVDFTPLVVGLHWPSLPWGNENLSAATHGLLGDGDAEGDIDGDREVDAYARRIADSPSARHALRTILEAAADAEETDELPDDVRAAYNVLFAESQLNSADVAGAPGADQDGFDAQVIFEEARSGI